MQTIFAERALLPTGWANAVRLTHDHGRVTLIETDVSAGHVDARVDTLLAAPGNLHSHCFQRAMAGMTEYRAAGRDSFWTWRRLMYRFVDRLTPEQYEAIAAQVFVEMMEAGFASVAEFHYVHHQKGGVAYDDPAELSARVFAAAAETGIGLTHLPVLYSYGGAGRAALSDGQLRFGNDIDAFLGLVERVRQLMHSLPGDARMGIAPHSLRATDPEGLRRLLSSAPNGPIHMHIAEQPLEVEEISDWLGARPVEWLLANAPVGPHWCLIHATHMTADETEMLARSGAVVGLCPITEANLGDGPFNGPAYLAAGGAFGVGSDSNVRISLSEELRQLEYSQRMRDLERNVMVLGEGSVGAGLFTRAVRGSAQALGRDAGRLEVGQYADLMAIDSGDPALFALRDDQLLDGFCFAANDSVVTDVWSAGRHMVTQGRHVARAAVQSRFIHAMTQLVDGI